MLLGDFYNIISSHRNNGLLSFRIELNPEHAIFKGHFPNLPVLPGVCQLRMMEELMQQVFEKDMCIRNAAQIKFLSFVNPGTHKQLDIVLNILKEEAGVFLVEGQYFWEDTFFLKFKGEFIG